MLLKQTAIYFLFVRMGTIRGPLQFSLRFTELVKQSILSEYRTGRRSLFLACRRKSGVVVGVGVAVHLDRRRSPPNKPMLVKLPASVSRKNSPWSLFARVSPVFICSVRIPPKSASRVLCRRKSRNSAYDQRWVTLLLQLERSRESNYLWAQFGRPSNLAKGVAVAFPCRCGSSDAPTVCPLLCWRFASRQCLRDISYCHGRQLSGKTHLRNSFDFARTNIKRIELRHFLAALKTKVTRKKGTPKIGTY